MTERSLSPRQALAAVLELGPQTLRELSQAASLSEKEVADHLPHIAKSARSSRFRWETEPAECLKCEFRFDGRARPKTPSRCPQCRSERIQPPRFSLVPKAP